MKINNILYQDPEISRFSTAQAYKYKNQTTEKIEVRKE